ncbi:Cyclin-dependent protein kinase [Halocaridina rubra]|uniref:Protein CNPPD1 n=1 Tax=Halocaridina rubra TaxID=373956 RepID=A0AAN9A3Y1_HALRR
MKTPKTPDKLKTSQFAKFLPEYLEYAERIRKTLYYGKLPSTDRPSLPFTGFSVEKISELCRQDGLEHLDMRYASSVCYDACVTPCSLILALMYIDRLRANNPEYLSSASPSQVFIVALLVASKYLYDDGEEDEVFNDEWATSAAVSLAELNQAERDFLVAIDWNLFVDADTFLTGFKRLESDLAFREGTKRGYFTYTDLLSITQILPSSYTAVINLMSHVFAVCMVGYTAAVVSVIASTLLAQECSHQLTMAVSKMTRDLIMRDTSAACPNSSLYLPATPVIESSVSLTELEDEIEDDEGSFGIPGLPSHALTTLTTSILLAISSPGLPRQHPNLGREKYRVCTPTKENKGCTDGFEECSVDNEFDPSDIRLPFTTGAYWPPSSQFGVNSFDLTIDVTDANVRYQKEDWVYSNPWMIPWLSWHVSPVYGLIHNFSGIGAPNMSGNGKMEYSLFEWLAWVGGMMKDVVEELVPESPEPSGRLTPLFGRVAVALS